MIINRRSWTVSVRINGLEVKPTDSHGAYITAASFLGALRLVAEGWRRPYDVLGDLFGDPSSRGLLSLSDFRIAAEAAAPELRSYVSTVVDRVSGTPASGRLVEHRVLHNATFIGTMRLVNGGTYPALLLYQAIAESLLDVRLGLGVHHGRGVVQRARMERRNGADAQVLTPVERTFRKASEELIDHIAHNRDLVDSLEWRDLERVMAVVFEEIGFSVRLTKAAQDGGKDIVLYCVSRSSRREAQKFYVELKHWRSGLRVGRGPIRKLLDVSMRDGATGAVLLSTSGFSRRADQNLASDARLYIGDLSTIHTLCRFHKASRQNRHFSGLALEEIAQLKDLRDWAAQHRLAADGGR